MPKEDCKYWDKCYQRNEHHLQKYNHPAKVEEPAQQTEADKEAPKRKLHAASPMEDKNQTQPEDAQALNKFDIAELRTEALSNISGKNYMEILQKRIRLAVQNEYEELLKSNEFLRHKFLVEMPPDFYAFWKFVSELKTNLSGVEVLGYFLKEFQLQLVGPFEFLAGSFHNDKMHDRSPGDYLRHWRFFYDPPEFQTIFVKRSTGVHYGYWRDCPQDKDNLLVARNDTAKGCEFEFVAGNAFDAFLYFLEKDFASTPFSVGAVANVKKAMQAFIETNQVVIEKLEALQKERKKKVVTKSFHRAGIVVPYDAKTQLGYRPLMVSDAELKKILKLFESVDGKAGDADDTVKTVVMEKLQPIATAASIALDECDFGTSLELGIDLFCSGRLELHMLIQSLLVPAYTLLSRPQFIAISKAHMEKRSKSLQLSIFDSET